MRRHAPQTTALLSMLVLSSYLAAAFVDCEQPVDARVREASRLAALEADPERVIAAHPAPTMSHATSHAGHGGTHAETSHAEHAATHNATTHAGHDGTHAATSHAGHERAPHVRVDAEPDRFVRAICVCGCSDTRARVGGNASRLGVTIADVYVARLLPATRQNGPGPARNAAPEAFFGLDPVPI